MGATSSYVESLQYSTEFSRALSWDMNVVLGINIERIFSAGGVTRPKLSLQLTNRASSII